MRKFPGVFLLFLLAVSCVPAKKYNDLIDREKTCSDELAKYKANALNFEASARTFEEKSVVLEKEISRLKKDTAQVGYTNRTLQAKYERMEEMNKTLEVNYDRLRETGELETASLTSDLLTKRLELQQRNDELSKLEEELRTKERLLTDREARVTELQALIARKDESTANLKNKVAHALQGFANKGLSIEEKNGRIYVSLEAKLLFASGSTTVEKNGRDALIELANVLQDEKELEIIVEGHTDTDQVRSSRHPKSNWELSVLRATAVIDILLANSTMNPHQLMAAGRSEFHPIDIDDKAKNRRIEVIISPNLHELFEIISED